MAHAAVPHSSDPQRSRPSRHEGGGADDPDPRLSVEDVVVVKTRKVRTAISGTMVGNFMEWFDFGVYGYMTLMLADLFFTSEDKTVTLLLTLLGFAVSFLVRPIGGLVLGPLGDKIGRQKVLFATMAMMATATALVGVLPTAHSIGVWAAIALYALKLVQGFSTGGEYAGAATYVSEFSPDGRRGYFSSFLDVGSYVGFAAGAGAVAATHAIATGIAGPDAMEAWGWRIPFLLAIPLGAIAIYFRARIPETPAFEAAEQGESPAGDKAAVAEEDIDASAIGVRKNAAGIVRHHWRELAIGIALVAATNTAGYALTSYMPTYLGDQLGYDERQSAVATIPALLVLSACLPLIGRLSDRIGRKGVYAIAAISTLVLLIPAFWVMHLNSFVAVQAAMFMVAIPVALYVAISASALPALFPTASRYGAMGIAYNVAVSLFGGTTPFIAQFLMSALGNAYMPALWIMLFSLIALICLPFMRESARRPLLGSFPTVETRQEAEVLVERQDEDPHLDVNEMPLPGTPAAPVISKGARGKA